jgi:uncharacterized membrane protein (DUF485 family)
VRLDNFLHFRAARQVAIFVQNVEVGNYGGSKTPSEHLTSTIDDYLAARLHNMKAVPKKKQQSKFSSFLESLSNEALGYVINTTIQVLIFPLFGVFLPLSVNMTTSGVHSFFGIIRIYTVRRLFSRLGKKQSRRSSLIECIVNVIAGTIISFFATLWIYPLFGADISTGSTFGITLAFLAVTLTRLYVLRRMFNNKLAAKRKAKKALKKNKKQALIGAVQNEKTL